MRRVLAITSIRSDYDLLSGVYRLLNDDSDIELKLLVSGAHLASSYGYTVDMIKSDGFCILAQLETLIDSDSNSGRLKTASLLLINSIDVVRNYNPDLIIYAGDREDVIVGGLLGAFLHIPTLHFFGGDHASDGHVDNPVRHATSKLSSFHAVTIDEHRKRLLSIGEEEENIFVIGNPALDKFLSIKPCDKDIIFNSLQCSDEFLNGKFAIVIFHAISEEIEVAACYFENILLALKKSGYKAFVSYPNTDPGGKTIINVINKYKEDQNFYFYKNLNREMFLSLYKYSSLIIGNSSSGIIESASIKIPCINVGNRQFNRANSGNVLFCDGSLESIISAIVNVNSDVFQEKLHNIINIYGSGNSCVKAFNLIKNLDLSSYPSKKYDPLFKSIL